MVNAIYSAHVRDLELVTMLVFALLGLLAKGATVAFYLRERPVTPGMVANVAPAPSEPRT
jgi:hypothetical protein